MNGSSEHRGTVPFPYRAVLSDIDGTLLDADRRVSERTARAVRTLTGNGIVFALVTGRMPSGIVEIRTALGGPVHAVCYSGALVLGPDNAVLASTKLQRCEAYGILSLLRREFPQFGPCFFSDFDWFVDDVSHPAVEREASIVHARPREADLEGLVTAGNLPNKLFCNCTYDNAAGASLADRIRTLFPNLTVIRSSSGSMVEVLPAGIDKARGVEQLLGALKVDIGDVLAFGDDMNDIPMLRAVGRGVAVGNAAPQVIGVADDVALAATDDGVARYLEGLSGRCVHHVL